MIFAVEINVVQNKNNDFDNKTFKDEGWNLYAFSTSWKKVLFHGKKAGKRVFFIKKGLEFYICHRWTPCHMKPIAKEFLTESKLHSFFIRIF